MEQKLLDVPEAAAALRLQESTIRAWILNKRIRYAKVGRRVFIRQSDIDQFITDAVVEAEGEQRIN